MCAFCACELEWLAPLLAPLRLSSQSFLTPRGCRDTKHAPTGFEECSDTQASHRCVHACTFKLVRSRVLAHVSSQSSETPGTLAA
eukprot:4803253-Pleurochrysis_carterae.AAC.1